jgi:hypothetical protein
LNENLGDLVLGTLAKSRTLDMRDREGLLFNMSVEENNTAIVKAYFEE